MQDLLTKGSDLNIEHSTAPCVGSYPSWWTSAESKAQQSTLSNHLSLKMAALPQYCQKANQLTFQFQDRESSSTQSTGQSYDEVVSVGESNPYGPSLMSTELGYTKSQEKAEEGPVKPSLSMVTQDYVIPSQVDCRQSFTFPALSYTDPYYGGFLAAYGQQPLIHCLQFMGLAPRRVALPLDLPHDEPIFVNSKQYRAILRRRQYRAKLQAQSRLAKARKPYLHESRHLHALRRARGSGGRFLNTKKLQDSKTSITTDRFDSSGSAQTPSDMRISESVIDQLGNHKEGTATTSCLDISSASNRDSIFCQQEVRFSGYFFPVGGNVESNDSFLSGGNQLYPSVLRQEER